MNIARTHIILLYFAKQGDYVYWLFKWDTRCVQTRSKMQPDEKTTKVKRIAMRCSAMCDLHLCIVNYTLIGCHVAHCSIYQLKIHVLLSVRKSVDIETLITHLVNGTKLKQKRTQSHVRLMKQKNEDEKRHENSWGAHK